MRNNFVTLCFTLIVWILFKLFFQNVMEMVNSFDFTEKVFNIIKVLVLLLITV